MAIIEAMNPMSTFEAAKSIGVSIQRMRALAHGGRVAAHKIGHRWVIEEIPSDRRQESGRPLSSGIAWAALAILGGQKPEWIDPTARSRLRRRMRDVDWLIRALGNCQARSKIERLRVLPSDISKIPSEVRIVPSGLSAITKEFDIVPGLEGIDAYISPEGLKRVKRRFRPAAAKRESNLILRVPTITWILGSDRAPIAVVAADLLDSEDPRVSRAGKDVLRGLLNGRNT